MLSAEKQVHLSAFLAMLPARVALRLAKAIELDRLYGGHGLPHELILAALRPKLRAEGNLERTPSPLRRFCTPFEDLLISRPRRVKQKGRIARQTLTPMWQWVSTAVVPAEAAAYVQRLNEDPLATELSTEKAIDDFRAAAASAMAAAIATSEGRKTALRAVGTEMAVEDIAEIALLLPESKRIAELQTTLPRPITVLDEATIAHLRDVYDQFNEACRDVAPYVAMIVMGRLARPWEALRLAAVAARRTTDTLISATDIGMVGELLFDDMEDYAHVIQSARPGDFDAEKLIEAVGSFAELSAGMVKELAMRRDGKWGQRLTKARAQVSEAIEKLLEKVPRDIAAAFAPQKTGGFGKSPKPLDLAKPIDGDKVGRAMRSAYLLAHSRPFAHAASFFTAHQEAYEDVTNTMRIYGEDLLRERRAAADPQAAAECDRHLNVLIDLTVLVLGEQDAELLRRRSRAAVAA